MASKTSLLELLYEALRSPYGLVVWSNDPAALKTRLYTVRKTDPDLQQLSLVVSRTSPETEIWIVKNASAAP